MLQVGTLMCEFFMDTIYMIRYSTATGQKMHQTLCIQMLPATSLQWQGFDLFPMQGQDSLGLAMHFHLTS